MIAILGNCLLAAMLGRDPALPDASLLHLEAAWQISCMITNDPGDRARCQEKTLAEMVGHGYLDRAMELAPQIEGWRRLSLYCDAAELLATQGRTNEARRYEAEAAFQVPGLSGWAYDRVLMKTARVKALLGDLEEVRRLDGLYATEAEFRGAGKANLALALAVRGHFEEALAEMSLLDEAGEYDLTVARAEGYRLLADTGALRSETAPSTLDRAWLEAGRVGGPRRHELQLEVVDAAIRLGEAARSRAWLEAATEEILSAGIPPYTRAPLAAEAALRWARLGARERAAGLCEEALLACGQIELIERPAVMARTAEVYMLIGNRARAEGLFAEALAAAAELLNPRPRCIACTHVFLSMAAAQVESSPFEAVRRKILSGFKSGES